MSTVKTVGASIWRLKSQTTALPSRSNVRPKSVGSLLMMRPSCKSFPTKWFVRNTSIWWQIASWCGTISYAGVQHLAVRWPLKPTSCWAINSNAHARAVTHFASTAVATITIQYRAIWLPNGQRKTMTKPSCTSQNIQKDARNASRWSRKTAAAITW